MLKHPLHRPENPASEAGHLLPGDERSARIIGRCAINALYQELATYPKPGLVSPVDNGSHDDMDAGLFFRSLFSLRFYFRDIAAAGMRNDSFADLRTMGLTAEKRMMQVTLGINTHRGAIFNLGLLAAAAGKMLAGRQSLGQAGLGATIRDTWGEEIRWHGQSLSRLSHGRQVSWRFGVGGAVQEASAGFPHVFEVGLPALQECLDGGNDLNGAAVQCLFRLMATLPDTNLLYRGGEEGLRFVQHSAGSFLAAGGINRPGWQARAVHVHRQLVGLNLSPGGSADLLAAVLFVNYLQTWSSRHIDRQNA